MRINTQNLHGSALVVTLVIATILGFTLASYLTVVSSQSRSVFRSQHWNQALVVAEAGLEDGLQYVNKFAGSDTLTDWTTTASASADGWSKTGNVYYMKRFLDAAKTTYYEVFITNVSNVPIIRSTGSVVLPSSLATGTTLKRTIIIQTKVDALFNVAMAALGAIDLKGNGVATDSFDSADPNYSTNGLYIATRRKAGGDVATNNTITNSNLSVGNANVAGHLITGPFGTYSIGPNGSVGDLPWVDAGTTGIKPGYAQNDMNVVFDDAELPYGATWLPTGPLNSIAGGKGPAPDGNTYDHVFLIGGDYTVTDSGTIYVGTNVSVRLNVTLNGGYSPNKIYVAGMGGNAGKMTAYLNGPSSATLTEKHVTQSGLAKNMAFMGLPSLTSLSYNGNDDFTGLIYAPQAVFSLNGGGSGDLDFVGSSVTKTVQMNGHYKFHYDEDLKKNGPNNGYVATSWKEL